MRRREFITLIGGTAAAWPLAARAQQPAMPVVGFLHQGSPEQNVERLVAYRKSLSEAGFIEGKNLAIEYRWAAGQNDRLPEMLADLIRRQVAVIVTPFSTLAAEQAKAATSTIPIVFVSGGDPVALGLVASLNRPGGNVTGVTGLNIELAAKRLELLRKLCPQAAHYFVLTNPTSDLAGPFLKELTAGEASLSIRFDILRARTAGEIEAAFATIAQQPNSVLVSSTDAFFFIRRSQIAALTVRYRVPAIFDAREYAVAGGLISYGANYQDLMHLAGGYTARVLKGEKPANLPVIRSAKFELVINVKTARALSLDVPPTFLALADEVIE